MKLKGRLLFDSVAGQTSGTPVPGAETTIDLPGSGSGTFTFTPPAIGWPNGGYKVEVSMLNEDGEQKDQKTGTFTVSGGAATRTTAPAETSTKSPAGQAPSASDNDESSNDNSSEGKD
jgi:hypothetical protein